MTRGHIEPTEIVCKSVLQRSKMPWADYSMNPYVGCAFGCTFCYVPALRKFRRQEQFDTWGGWVEAKVNAPLVLRAELAKLVEPVRITIGTATDAWQPAEKRLGLTRSLLTILAEHQHHLSVISRSPLLLRDIPILQRIAARGSVHVGISLSTFDELARRHFEPNAPAVAGRCFLIRALLEAGVNMSLYWMPLLPGVTDNREAAWDYVERAAELGVKRICCGLLNYRDVVKPGYSQRLAGYYAACGARDGAVNRGRAALSKAQLAAEIGRAAARMGVDCSPSFA